MDTQPEKKAQTDRLTSLQAENTAIQNRLNSLKQDEDTWNRRNRSAALWSVVIAGLIGLIGGGAVWLTAKTATKASLDSRPLQTRKDSNDASIRLIEKEMADMDILKAQTDAGTATKLGQDAKTKAEEAERKNIELKASFDQSVEDSKIQAETLRKANLDTEAKLGAEQAKRLELEKTIAPRDLPELIEVDGKSDLDTLKPFKGMNVLINFVPEFEPKRLAMELSIALGYAGWHVVEFSPNENMGDGIEVLRYSLPPEEFLKSPMMGERYTPSAKAAQALTEFLKGCDIEARYSQAPHGEFPGMTLHDPNSIRVRVGMKPTPYFDPEWVKKQKKKMDEMISAAPLPILPMEAPAITNAPCHPSE